MLEATPNILRRQENSLKIYANVIPKGNFENRAANSASFTTYSQPVNNNDAQNVNKVGCYGFSESAFSRRDFSRGEKARLCAAAWPAGDIFFQVF